MPRHLPIEVEDTALFLIEFKNGVIATFDNSIGITSARTPGWNLEIYGERGTISCPYGGILNIGVFYSVVRPNGWTYKNRVELIEPTGPKYMDVEVFLSAVLEGQDLGVTAEEGKKGVEIAIACYKSHFLGGKRIKLPLSSDDFSIGDAFKKPVERQLNSRREIYLLNAREKPR